MKTICRTTRTHYEIDIASKPRTTSDSRVQCDLVRTGSVATEFLKLMGEALVYKDSLKSAFVINRRIANTAIGRAVRDALTNHAAPTLAATVTQRVIFAEALASGRATKRRRLDTEQRHGRADSMKHLTIDIPDSLHRAIKAQCAAPRWRTKSASYSRRNSEINKSPKPVYGNGLIDLTHVSSSQRTGKCPSLV